MRQLNGNNNSDIHKHSTTLKKNPISSISYNINQNINIKNNKMVQTTDQNCKDRIENISSNEIKAKASSIFPKITFNTKRAMNLKNKYINKITLSNQYRTNNDNNIIPLIYVNESNFLSRIINKNEKKVY